MRRLDSLGDEIGGKPLDTLLLVVPAAIAFPVGLWLGKRASWIILAACALGAIALSIYARSNLAASGLHGWVYYTPENNWPITTGIALMLAGIVAAVQLALSERILAFVFSCALVTLFVTLQVPLLFVACAGFGACV